MGLKWCGLGCLSCGQSGQLITSLDPEGPCYSAPYVVETVALLFLEGVPPITLIPQGFSFNLLLLFSFRVGSFLECLIILVCK